MANLMANWSFMTPKRDFYESFVAPFKDTEAILTSRLNRQQLEKQLEFLGPQLEAALEAAQLQNVGIGLSNEMTQQKMPFITPQLQAELQKMQLANLMSEKTYEQMPALFAAQTGLMGAQAQAAAANAAHNYALVNNPILMANNPVSAALLYGQMAQQQGQIPSQGQILPHGMQNQGTQMGSPEQMTPDMLNFIASQMNGQGEIGQESGMATQSQSAPTDMLGLFNQISTMLQNRQQPKQNEVQSSREAFGLTPPPVPSVTGNPIADEMLVKSGVADPAYLATQQISTQQRQKNLDQYSDLILEAAQRSSSATDVIKDANRFHKNYNAENQSSFPAFSSTGPVGGLFSGVTDYGRAADNAAASLTLNMSNLYSGKGGATDQLRALVEESKLSTTMKPEAERQAYNNIVSSAERMQYQEPFYLAAAKAQIPAVEIPSLWNRFNRDYPLTGDPSIDKQNLQFLSNYLNPSYTKPKESNNSSNKGIGKYGLSKP